MICTLDELHGKEVIDINNGERLGYIDDLRIDTETSEVVSMLIYGGYRLFGIFGRENDTEIPCSSIRVIGSDVILVSSDSLIYTKNKRNVLKKLFE